MGLLFAVCGASLGGGGAYQDLFDGVFCFASSSFAREKRVVEKAQACHDGLDFWKDYELVGFCYEYA